MSAAESTAIWYVPEVPVAFVVATAETVVAIDQRLPFNRIPYP